MPAGMALQIKVSKTPFDTRVAVADQGAGISSDARDNLFRRFAYPSVESNTSQAGAGLGLSVVKAIIEAHGGHVGVDDRPNGGSVFWFTLPVVEGE